MLTSIHSVEQGTVLTTCEKKYGAVYFILFFTSGRLEAMKNSISNSSEILIRQFKQLIRNPQS